jgi:hypothetical protein
MDFFQVGSAAIGMIKYQCNGRGKVEFGQSLGGGTIEELQIAQSKLTWENLSTQIL